MKMKRPNKSITLCFDAAPDSYGLPCKRIRIDDFPREGGVYVVRYRDRMFPRLTGESNILKVGQAANFMKRFTSYNGKRAATSFEKLSQLREWASKAWTEWHFMWLTEKESRSSALVIEFYYSNNPPDLERRFIATILDMHNELPPLNLNMGTKSSHTTFSP